MDKNQTESKIYLDITDIDSRGRGVGRLADGRVCFVPFAITGERVSVAIESQKSSYVLGRLLSIENSASSRIVPRCKVFGRCGGCSLLHMDYEAQLLYKSKLVDTHLKKFAAITDVEVLPCRPSPEVYNYRNKAVFRLRRKEGALEMGFFEEESHTLVDTDYCHICSQGIGDMQKAIRELVPDINASEVTIRERDGNALIDFFAPSQIKFDIAKLAKHMEETTNEFGIFLTVGRKTKHICGKQVIAGSTCGIRYEASPQAFLQVNSKMAQILYSDALNLITPTIDHNLVVVDAYCGIGILSSLVAQRVSHVYGIEIVPEAIENAKKLAKNNNISNATFIAGDCSSVISSVLSQLDSEESSQKKVTVLLDPPRRGCSSEVIAALLTHLPDRIVYISCDSATLGRDIRLLEPKYRVKLAAPYDMFPHTSNVEVLAYLEKK